jgi:hypothetical protein
MTLKVIMVRRVEKCICVVRMIGDVWYIDLEQCCLRELTWNDSSKRDDDIEEIDTFVAAQGLRTAGLICSAVTIPGPPLNQRRILSPDLY